MPKKRKSRGQRKGSKGSGEGVQCTYCGAMVPRAKAKKVYKRVSFLDPRLAYELRKKGAYIPGSQSVEYACIKCAVHRGMYSPRAQDERRKPFKKPRKERY